MPMSNTFKHKNAMSKRVVKATIVEQESIVDCQNIIKDIPHPYKMKADKGDYLVSFPDGAVKLVAKEDFESRYKEVV